jgi:hypothetical protein
MRLPVHAFMIYILARFYDIPTGHHTWFVLTCNELSLCSQGLHAKETKKKQLQGHLQARCILHQRIATPNDSCLTDGRYDDQATLDLWLGAIKSQPGHGGSTAVLDYVEEATQAQGMHGPDRLVSALPPVRGEQLSSYPCPFHKLPQRNLAHPEQKDGPAQDQALVVEHWLSQGLRMHHALCKEHAFATSHAKQYDKDKLFERSTGCGG